jgi:hypothetical protein
VSTLLPWYVTGTLDAADKALVERAIAVDVGLRAELELVKEDRDVTRVLAGEDLVPASMAARFDALFAQEEAGTLHAAPLHRAAAKPGLLERLSTFLAQPRRLVLAAAAIALIMAVQAGAILNLVGERSTAPGFSTASGPGESDGLAVLVQFLPELTLAEINAWLTTNKARITDGPLPGGLYRVRFESESDENSTSLAERLRGQRDLFSLVLPAQ